jgi:hypothetical protein
MQRTGGCMALRACTPQRAQQPPRVLHLRRPSPSGWPPTWRPGSQRCRCQRDYRAAAMSAQSRAGLPGATGGVERGLAFLAGAQLPSGQFATYVGPDVRSGATFESSPFTTALVVHSIGGSGDPRAREMIDRALDFLSAEMEPGGFWPSTRASIRRRTRHTSSSPTTSRSSSD